LSARILKAIYYTNEDFLEAQRGSHPSQIWRAIIDGRDTLKQGLIRRIGTGEKTHAWNDIWLPRDKMLRPIVCKKANPPVAVASFINSASASWNVQKLEEYFLPMGIEVIRAIPLGTTRFDDFWGWQFERTGVFSVRSAYRMIVNSKVRRGAWLEGTETGSDHKQEEKDWTTLWKVQVPSKIRVFLWRLAKQSIPTNDV
jgi:hypothetical protein